VLWKVDARLHRITYMLSRNIRVEADLIDQLFNSTEKRLARTLLLLAMARKTRPSEYFRRFLRRHWRK
jgi:hypothetical protein